MRTQENKFIRAYAYGRPPVPAHTCHHSFWPPWPPAPVPSTHLSSLATSRAHTKYVHAPSALQLPRRRRRRRLLSPPWESVRLSRLSRVHTRPRTRSSCKYYNIHNRTLYERKNTTGPEVIAVHRVVRTETRVLPKEP